MVPLPEVYPPRLTHGLRCVWLRVGQALSVETNGIQKGLQYGVLIREDASDHELSQWPARVSRPASISCMACPMASTFSSSSPAFSDGGCLASENVIPFFSVKINEIKDIGFRPIQQS